MHVPSISLNDKHTIPQLGFGTWKIADNEVDKSVEFAVKTGYRHIDTARIYENEKGVGTGLRRCDVPREQLFLTTKLWNSDQGYEQTLRAFEASLKRLQTDYLDLYLIHWPCPQRDLYVETWRALIHLQSQGLTKSIGVSNFRVEDLQRLIKETGIIPAVNQIEVHPYFQEAELRAFHQQHNIATVAYSPLGRGALLGDPVLGDIARRHGKTPGQITLRWHIEIGNIIIPKSVTQSRIIENFHIFDFRLTPEDMAAIAALHKADGRQAPDPAEFAAL
ncbi:MAG: aldo/keto reductase [Candidatus Tokpelaia sp.]|nr:MAG: aldo/keto reductase [Candidatus Tokpelaia sp.]KAA6205739.1 MAG: aldo/keto reductase [Candidatus Tokpelaia sp.]